MKYGILLLYTLVYLTTYSQSSTKEYRIHTIAFYNLENLCDTIDDSSTKDEYSPILKMNANKSKAYWKKIDNLAKVISEIGKEKTNTSPALIGVSEIENGTVLNDLVNSRYLQSYSYNFIHEDSPDWRGMDVALLYNEKIFQPSDFTSSQLFAFNEKGYRIKTRDQLVVSGYLDNEEIHVIINHWPSQLQGQSKTEYLRVKSAELNLKIIEKLNLENSNSKIITMGDFNDNPTATSIKQTLQASSKKGAKTLYNPFEKLLKKGIGSMGYRDQLTLFDQIILSPNWTLGNYKTYQFYQAGVYNPTYLTQKKGKFKGYPYRSWSNNNEFTGGYSDHYPVYIYVVKEK